MTNFALTSASNPQAVIQSLNYALSNLGGNVLTINPNGSVVTGTGQTYSYLYQYLWVAYGTSATGANFSFSPTGASYYGVRSNSSSTPSTNPADYTWTEVSGGFGSNRYLWYITYGGGQINFYIGTTAPNSQYQKAVNGVPINLYIVTATTGSNGAPGSNGITSVVRPSIISFPQNTDGSYTPTTQTMSASFYSNIQNIAYANLNVAITSSGNVNLVETYVDPSISISTIYSNAASNNLTIDFLQNTGASGTGLVTVLVNGLPGNAANVGANGISSYSYTTYTLANTVPLMPQANTGSWNFATTTGTPPLDPGLTPANTYIKQSTISFGEASANVATITSPGVVYNGNTYNYYTTYPTVPSDFGSGYHYSTFNITGNVAYVDILLVGSGSPGNNTQVTGYLNSAGGNAGNVQLISNVALNPGTYSLDFIYNQDEPYSENGNTVFYSGNIFLGGVTQLYTAPGGAVPNQSAAGTGAGGAGQSFITGNPGPYSGGAGVPVPLGGVTWIGQNISGTYYIAGGGGAGGSHTTSGGGGGAGGGGTGGYYNGNYVAGTSGLVATGSGGGGGSTGPGVAYGYGGPGVAIIRQHLPYSNPIYTWQTNIPAPTPTQAVFSTTSTVTTSNAYPTANVVAAYWSSPSTYIPLAPAAINVTYPLGQYITSTNGVYSPTPVAGVVTLTANIQAIRSNTILAAVTQQTNYFITNGAFTISSIPSSEYNYSAFNFSTPTTTQYNLIQNFTYGDIGGNVSGYVSEALLQGTQGNIGPAGFIPLAYIVTTSDPTVASTSTLSSWYSSPRTNTAPPIGVGIAPQANDTAQFFFPEITSNTGGITSVQIFDGNVWSNVNAQVISGATIFTGTITAEQINVNEVYALTIASTSAYGQVGNVSSPGFWLAADTGDAHFAGNLTVGNQAVIGSNLAIGNSAVIGSNLAIGNNAVIGQNLVVASQAQIGDSVLIGNNAVIGNNLVIGNNAVIGNNLSIGSNLSLGNNINIGNNAVIGGNLTVSGLISGGELLANTVTGTIIQNNTIAGNNIQNNTIAGNNIQQRTISNTNIQYNSISTTEIANYTIQYVNLSPSLTSLLGVPFGTPFSNANVSLTGTGSYDYYSTAYGYVKLLGYNEFYPGKQQAAASKGSFGATPTFNIAYQFNVTGNGYPTSSTYLYVYTNTWTQGGANTIQLNNSGGTTGTGSGVFIVGPTGPDETTFSSQPYSGQVSLGLPNNTFNNVSGQPLFYGNGYATIGLALTNSTGAGNIQISNLTWSVTYP